MKVIDLYNKIANGEEVPKEIKVNDNIYYYDETDCNEFYRYRTMANELLTDYADLNDEVEIIEDTPKEYVNVSEEQVLFNNLSYEEQQFILKQMRMLQPLQKISNGEEND